jgi:hypothetical protein
MFWKENRTIASCRRFLASKIYQPVGGHVGICEEKGQVFLSKKESLVRYPYVDFGYKKQKGRSVDQPRYFCASNWMAVILSKERLSNRLW